jgi:hypothetical protein
MAYVKNECCLVANSFIIVSERHMLVFNMFSTLGTFLQLEARYRETAMKTEDGIPTFCHCGVTVAPAECGPDLGTHF